MISLRTLSSSNPRSNWVTRVSLAVSCSALSISLFAYLAKAVLDVPFQVMARNAAGLRPLPFRESFQFATAWQGATWNVMAWWLALCIAGSSITLLIDPSPSIKNVAKRMGWAFLISASCYWIYPYAVNPKPWRVVGDLGTAYHIVYHMPLVLATVLGALLAGTYYLGFERLIWKEEL
ncbi:MAG: hypothetical protein JNM28_06370 [Armatimonadetes bacterium]|nr:hypothetical protein [Armatimonadota bacterium]